MDLELLMEFLVESYEGLDRLDEDFVALEADPTGRERLSSIFRTIHTIKGTCGFLDLPRLEQLTHAGENLLSLLREGSLALTAELTTLLLRLVDTVRDRIEYIEANHVEHDGGDDRLAEALLAAAVPTRTTAVAQAATERLDDDTPQCDELQSAAPQLTALQSDEPQSAVLQSDEPQSDEPQSAVLQSAVLQSAVLQSAVLQSAVLQSAVPQPDAVAAVTDDSAIVQTSDPSHTPDNSFDALGFDGGHSSPPEAAAPDSLPADSNDVGSASVGSARVNSAAVEVAAVALATTEFVPLEAVKMDPNTVEAVTPESPRSSAATDNIRVNVSLLDSLVDLVGELVLARNQIVQIACSTEDNMLAATSQRLNILTTELQENVMKVRMQPIGGIWRKFPRVVRDLALACHKEVRVEMVGEDTELDRTLIEAIRDPLTHMVRNAADHGIETPAQRIAAGKPAEGCLSLRAYHEGGQVNIEISDDGRGLDLDRLKKKALKARLITPEQAGRMNDRDLAQLAFEPGLSTAEAVTNVSGRGVGMDVVRSNIEKIGGTIDLQTVRGQGTTIRLKIPLTLAIIPALLITSGDEQYAIPQVNLLELVRLERSHSVDRIQMIGTTPVYRLRGRLLPLVSLNSELKIGAEDGQTDAISIVVLRAD
ncbi:MAG: two-component system chemotaxis sensor kinase CheA, partial [Myxococcota bacterium]